MAPKYRKIDPRMWDDEQFDELPAGEALVATWLLTSKEVLRCGVAVFTLGTAADKGRLQGVKEAWDTLSTVCTKMDWPVQKTSRSTVVVIFPRWFKHNPPTNLDHFKGMMSDMSDVPRCDVIKSHYHRTKCDLMDKYHDTFDTLSRGCTTGCTPKPSTPEAEAEAEAEAEDPKGTKNKSVIDLSHFPPCLAESVTSWLRYKTERRETYKPEGLKSFLTQITKASDMYGAERVADALESAASNGHMGWKHEVEKNGRKQKTFDELKLERTAQAVRDFGNE